MTDPFQQLRNDVCQQFAAPIDVPIPDDVFNRLALTSFELQLEGNAPYAAYCARRGRTQVDHWSMIPAVPTVAFKEVRLVVGDDAPEAIFRTSGTTRGYERRGQHFIRDLALYHEALEPMFSAYLLPDRAKLPLYSLVPSHVELPESSLAHMLSFAVERLGAGDSAFVVTRDGGLQYDLLMDRLRAHIESGEPVGLLGTSLSFVHLLDMMLEHGDRLRLPDGSRLMDTGGFKGQQRELSPADLRARYAALLGVEPLFAVNEYGMTELGSQFYDGGLRDLCLGTSPRPELKRIAPWVRSRAVHPDTLQPLPPGEVGLLQHFDLANIFSVCAIQTEDLGRVHEDGFELLGRAPGATPRGCSIAMDMLLEANR